MKREVLIKKWLDNELNSQELEAFKQLEDYADLIRLSQATKQFKPENTDVNFELERLNNKLQSHKKTKTNWVKPLLRFAAILVVGFSVFYYTNTLDTSINTQIAQKENIVLPDNSQVTINAMSTLSFNEKSWEDNRHLNLDGEAYFKVAKGKTFTVETTTGSIHVLGTEFNVKNRDNIFEVVCYEGSVRVNHLEHSQILKPGECFLILNNTTVKNLNVDGTNPFWINNESAFKSMPFTQVIAEFDIARA